MTKIVMIIAPDQFRDEEYLEPKEIFENAGAEVITASKDVDSATGKLGAQVMVDIDISEINVDEYDAVVFVGGSGARGYFEDEIALKIAKDAYEKEKVIAAICIAPTVLANAGILEGKRCTSYPAARADVEKRCGEFINSAVVVDGKIVTAQDPPSAKEFAQKVLEAL